MIRRLKVSVVEDGLTRELGQGILLLGLAGSSVGGLVGILTIASRALGR